MSEPKETVDRIGNYSGVFAGEGYNRPGAALCRLENTGNGYIAHFPANNCTRQDYYVCLDYAQAHDLILALSMFKKELGFAEPTDNRITKTMGHKIDSTGAAAVATNYYWLPINKDTPRGVKLQLLGHGGVAQYSSYHGDPFWTHWCPLPKRRD